MVMEHALIYAIAIIVLGVLVVNKDVTLTVLNNISFKWIFEKKITDEVRKTETSVTVKEIKTNKDNHLSRYIGMRMIFLGALFLLVVGISWAFTSFQYVKAVGTKVYMDAPSTGRSLIVFESVCTGIFTILMIIVASRWSNEAFEQRIIEKHQSK